MSIISPPKRSAGKVRPLAIMLALILAGASTAIVLSRHSPGTDPSAISKLKAEFSRSPRVPIIEGSEYPDETEPAAASTAARQDRSPAETLEALAAHDASRALSLALGEPDNERRQEFLQAVLRGWASSAPEAAADWALTQPHIESGLAMAAVFNGATHNPDNAVSLALRLTAQHPGNSSSYGSYLIFGLAQFGEFERAASFAASSAADVQVDLLTAAYSYWAKQQPERAVFAALRLEDPGKQDAAFQAAVGGWARTSPQELTATASRLPEGPDRTLALTTGLRSWIEKDPAAAADWISRHSLTEKEAVMVLEE